MEFCNKTNSIQTDVGICVGSDAKQAIFNGNIFKTNEMKMVEGGRKDVEHVMILMVDKFGQLNNPPDFIVSFKNNASYDRLWEARKIWGGIVNSSRSWTIMVKDFIVWLLKAEQTVR